MMAPRKNASKAAPTPTPKTKAKAASKAKPATKTTTPAASNTKRKINSKETATSKKQKVKDDNSCESTPPWEKGIRSQNQRKKSGFQLTRASLLDESLDSEESIAKLFEGMEPTSLTNLTWGQTSNSGTKAIKRRRPRKLNISRVKYTGDGEEQYVQMMEHITKQSVNRGDTRYDGLLNNSQESYLLRWSYEIREGIYEHFLIANNNILLRSDMSTIETKIVADHAIRRVCRILYKEGTAFLFRKNDVRTIFRKTSRAANHQIHHIVNLPVSLVSMVRNVTLEFNAECWSKSWYEKAAACIGALSAAKVHLSCLTLNLTPIQINQITKDGDLINAIRELHPRVLKLVVRKGPTKKLTFEIGFTHLDALWRQSEQYMNPKTEEILLQRSQEAETELHELRERFEYISYDDVGMTRLGLCASNEPLPIDEESEEEIAKQVAEAPDLAPDGTNSLDDGEAGRTDLVAHKADIMFEDDPQEISTDIEMGDEDEESDDEIDEEDERYNTL
jgi:hypothetical protein